MQCCLSDSRKVGGTRGLEVVGVGVICAAWPHDMVICEAAS